MDQLRPQHPLQEDIHRLDTQQLLQALNNREYMIVPNTVPHMPTSRLQEDMLPPQAKDMVPRIIITLPEPIWLLILNVQTVLLSSRPEQFQGQGLCNILLPIPINNQ
jgi:hypothetical protein